MKIGTTICEYNPFHNGHLYFLEQIKQELKPDAIAVIMSGNFTQRGQTAVMHKYARARHAIEAGADIVFELPVAFATAPAEIFAKGAVKLLASLKGEKTLCFGMESGTKESLMATAKALSDETREFKAALKAELALGHPLARARFNALEKINPAGIDLSLASAPNNMLALEYARAVIEGEYDMDLMPVRRMGNGYSDSALKKGEYPSAFAVREAIASGKKKKALKFVPDYVYRDLPDVLPSADGEVMTALSVKTKREMRKIVDCGEGLENRIKALLKDSFTREELLARLATKRYTSTRLARVTLAALLGTTADETERYLKNDLYLKVLAINAERRDLLSAIRGKTPFITRKSEADLLSGAAEDCFAADVFANDIYNRVTKTKTNEYETLFVYPKLKK